MLKNIYIGVDVDVVIEQGMLSSIVIITVGFSSEVVETLSVFVRLNQNQSQKMIPKY